MEHLVVVKDGFWKSTQEGYHIGAECILFIVDWVTDESENKKMQAIGLTVTSKM